MNEIELKINDTLYGGWKSLQVDLSMDQMAGAFGFSMTDLFPGHLDKWQIKMGDECKIVLNNYVLITGYVDQINIGYDDTSHNIQISGRDKTADLVDCSFVSDKNEWKSLTVASIIKKLCSPFGIIVIIDKSVIVEANKKEKTFKTNEGQTVSEAIIGLCQNKAILPLTFGDGKLTLTRAGIMKAKDALVLGQNIKNGNLNQSDMDRFSNYIVKSQGSGNDNLSLSDYTHTTGGFEDKVMTRYRPLVILSDKKVDDKGAKDLAKWEAGNRAGKSRGLNYGVQGWVQSDGTPWQINRIVEIKDNFLNIKQKFLISRLSFSLSEAGRMTSITLVHPGTYELNPQAVEIKGPSDKEYVPMRYDFLRDM